MYIHINIFIIFIVIIFINLKNTDYRVLFLLLYYSMEVKKNSVKYL